MSDNNIAAIIISNNDPHQSEYLAEHWQAIKWLTGFSGSAGTAVVTLFHAVLWTDFRYYIQAEKQISGSQFKLYKTGKQGVPEYQKWLCDTLNPKDTIGINGNVFSTSAVKKLKTRFKDKKLLLNTNIDFISILWTKRPVRPSSMAFLLSAKYAGQTRADKILIIRNKMNAFGASYHLMSSLDDIAWTLNLRGKDVHTNPVNIAFLLICPEKIFLFINKKKIDKDIAGKLGKDNIELAEYENIYPFLSQIKNNTTILINPENTNYRLYQSINKKCKIIEKPSPAVDLKAVKNNTQITHLRQTAIKDGVAIVRFLFWLEHHKKDAKITEISAANKLFKFRKDQDLFVDNSFAPIMAYKEHSAMCHYLATKKTNAVIGDTGMFLTDSGGNYLTGTTDITRTICRGKPLKQEITDYTLVLKGHIAVAATLFPKGTKGFQIDTLARQYLWNQGMDFGHGTGHGVGFFLCVHEGPANISPHPVDVKLKKGMVLTNEPGLYKEGSHGIRLENMMLIDHAFKNDFGTFMKFEPLTYCHFEKNLIDKNMLSSREINWLNNYHAMVYEKLCRNLDHDIALWLKKKTSSL